MKKYTTVFQHKTETYTSVTGKVTPMTLLVTTEYTPDGTHISIKGEKNPLPFKSAVIKPVCNLNTWIENMGYKKIGEF
ncbi:hypothetical protein [Blautia intestinalis]|uniref:hypothetical protein n=1 Tax=Blautia intestinalis TaxID=2763028 RepID=UPI0022E15509|nr:hypothetical protein [Blautia intestinalis]